MQSVHLPALSSLRASSLLCQRCHKRLHPQDAVEHQQTPGHLPLHVLPVDRFLGDLRLRIRPGDDIPLSLMESCVEEALPVASLFRIMLS